MNPTSHCTSHSTNLDSLRWRYAVKHYDPHRTLSPDDLAHLREAVRLAPSSLGLQPYRLLFVVDPALRAELRAASHWQAQVTEAAVLVVFATEDVVDEAYVRRLFAGQPAARIDAALATIARKTPDELREWTVRQAYVALGFLLFAAAERRIDANPMEGFVGPRYDAILGLRERGLSSAVIAALGHRSADDRAQHRPKLRRPESELFRHVDGGER